MLLVIDESHMTIPQLRAMPQADASRKANLVKHGFRLPSAEDHRPVGFFELEHILGRRTVNSEEEWIKTANSEQTENYLQNQYHRILQKIKPQANTLFLSATPAQYDLELSENIVQQIIRPTGLLDPITYVYPKTTDYDKLQQSLDDLLKKKSHLSEFLDGYSLSS